MENKKKEIYLYSDGIYGLFKNKNYEFTKKIYNIDDENKNYQNLKPFINQGSPNNDFKFVIEEYNLITSWNSITDMMNVVHNLFDNTNEKQIIRTFGFVNTTTHEFKYIIPKQILSSKQQNESVKLIEDKTENEELNNYLFSEENDFENWLYVGQFIFINKSDLTKDTEIKPAFSSVPQKVFLFEDFDNFYFSKGLSVFILNKNGIDNNTVPLTATDVKNLIQFPIQAKKTNQDDIFSDDLIQRTEYEYVVARFNFINLEEKLLNKNIINIVNHFSKEQFEFPYLLNSKNKMKEIKKKFQELTTNNKIDNEDFEKVVKNILNEQLDEIQQLKQKLISFDKTIKTDNEEKLKEEQENNKEINDIFNDDLLKEDKEDKVETKDEINKVETKDEINKVETKNDIDKVETKDDIVLSDKNENVEKIKEIFDDETNDENKGMINNKNSTQDDKQEIDKQQLNETNNENTEDEDDSLDDLSFKERFVTDQNGVPIYFTANESENENSSKDLVDEDENKKQKEAESLNSMLQGDF